MLFGSGFDVRRLAAFMAAALAFLVAGFATGAQAQVVITASPVSIAEGDAGTSTANLTIRLVNSSNGSPAVAGPGGVAFT
jgi:hypothetical protein